MLDPISPCVVLVLRKTNKKLDHNLMEYNTLKENHYEGEILAAIGA